ncbi:hypothetical protein [Streptomyces sp. NBC_01235]|uniref:hypothetical protein n=1 Tax=Streptomyces sp. NBC_01235 TaxID=2903788 RepID=UPI002E10D6FD|nr:hypothetical protein OG289_27070 [Streptomyces sp. NBC_01235]
MPHVAWFADDAFHVLDVRESEEHVTRFIATGFVSPGVSGTARRRRRPARGGYR